MSEDESLKATVVEANEGTNLMNAQSAPKRTESFSQASEDSQTAAEYINSQLQLEADAREALPYTFDTCTKPLGPLRQSLFSCLTCNPPSSSDGEPYNPAGVCYSCSISCHGEHTLVELFNKRNFECDCGTTRLPASCPCTLRINAQTGTKGNVNSEEAAAGNKYNHNFKNRFCSCNRVYDAQTEKGTMYQCLGLGTVEEGGCGEDWYHPECLVGVDQDWFKKQADLKSTADGEAKEEDDPPNPPGFPEDDDFEGFICFKCVDAFPWIKRYAGTTGFLPPVYRKEPNSTPADVEEKPTTTSAAANGTAEYLATVDQALESSSRKRKAEDEPPEDVSTENSNKRTKAEAAEEADTLAPLPSSCKYNSLPPISNTTPFSLFVKPDFRDNFCRCPSCFPLLAPHQQLLEEEDIYQPPISESGDDEGGGSVGSKSLLDRGEAALSNVDRVRAIEGVMAYNHLKDKVKTFLQPFAESGKPVGAEDIKAYFEKLRGDSEAIKAAGGAAGAGNGNGNGNSGGDDAGGSGTDQRKEQNGY